MKYLINYANGAYKKTQHLNTKSAGKYGFDKIIEYSEADVDKDFYNPKSLFWSLNSLLKGARSLYNQ